MIPFTKMHGIGNDFVLIDGIAHPIDAGVAIAMARKMGDRHFGVGSDGLILADKAPDGALRMRMWNPDGSESEMCGNGIRCFAKFVKDLGYATGNFIPVETGAGKLVLEILESGQVRVDMGSARLTRGEIGMSGPPSESFIDQQVEIEPGMTLPGTAVSMGNPHLVLFTADVASVPLDKWGPQLEHHPSFPNRVNVHFVQADLPTRLIQRTWERGAGATLACGTGACAVGVAGAGVKAKSSFRAVSWPSITMKLAPSS
jgi:diaminopimelate epimerase